MFRKMNDCIYWLNEWVSRRETCEQRQEVLFTHKEREQEMERNLKMAILSCLLVLSGMD